ncbi:MAG: DMT family transporter [Bacilli bacterium]
MKKFAHIAGVLFSAIFGLTFMFSKIALDYISPMGLIAYRFLLAFIAFEILRLLKIIKIHFNKKQIGLLVKVSLMEPVLYFIFETFGLTMISSGEAGMMIALIPIFVTILSFIFLKETIRVMQIIFIVISVGGVLLIQLMNNESDPNNNVWGIILLLLAVLSAGFFNILSRKASQVFKPVEITYFMMLAGAVSFNAIYLGQLLINGNIAAYITNLGHWEIVLPIVYLSIVASIGGYFLVNFALGQLPAHVTSIYSNLSTIVALIAGVLILQEQLFGYHYLGAALIILGVYGTVWLNARPLKKDLEVTK